MARKYAVEGANAAAPAPKTILTLIAAATTRAWIYDIIIGNSSSPLDLASKFDVMRFTAVGTAGTTPLGRALDPQNPAALITCGTGHSAEPTYTVDTELLTISLNQRATFRWVASPGGELVTLVTALSGIGLRWTTGTTNQVNEGTIHWEE